MHSTGLPTPWNPGAFSGGTALGDVLVYRLSGDLDVASAPALAFDKPLDGVRAVVVDLADVGFFASSALNALLRLRQDTEGAGLHVHLSALPRTAARVLEITGADTLFQVHPNLDAALNSLR